MASDAKPLAGPGDARNSAAQDARHDTVRAFWRVLTTFDRSKMLTYRALRNALGVALPVAVGFALGMPRGGVAVAGGALNVAYSDNADPYEERAKRMLASSVLCACAVFAGAISGRNTIVAVFLSMLWAFVAGLCVSISAAAGDLGVISLVSLLIYASQRLTPRDAMLSGILTLAGGLFQTMLSLAPWPVQRYEPERRALAAYFLELAQAAQTAMEAHAAPLASRQSTQAQHALSGLSRDATIEGLRYRALLNQAERIRLSLLMLARLRLRMERENKAYPAIALVDLYLQKCVRLLRLIGEALSTGKLPTAPPEDLAALEPSAGKPGEEAAASSASFLSAVAQDARYQMDALGGQLRSAFDLAANATPAGQAAFAKQEARQPWWLRFSGRLATLRANLNLRSAAFRHALRLAACVALGDLLVRSLPWRRTYWLAMTIVLVLKPEFAVTFSRGVLRIFGTIAGLLLATVLFHFVPANAVMLILLIAAFTFFLRWAGAANYGIFTIAISALIVLLLAVTGVSPKEVIWARGLNTAAGGAIALLAYWLWPTWERTTIAERIAQLFNAYRAYSYEVTQSYLREGSQPTSELDRARLASRMARSNLEASIDRLGAEPGTTAEQMDTLNAILASSHRFIHAVMAVEAGLLQTRAVPARPEFWTFAADVEKTLSLLSLMLSATRVPAKEFPDLRADHTQMLQSGDPRLGRYALSNVEADRMTNSLNTLREQVQRWLRIAAAK